MLCVMAIEYALKHPGANIKYCAPTKVMVRKIIRPHFRDILKDCPDELRPEWSAVEQTFLFKNGAQVQVAGADSGNSESLRGTRLDIGFIDEAGFIADLDYLVKDILLPQTITTRGHIIITSTPAKTPRHAFEEYSKAAELEGNYIKKTIYQNPLLSKSDIEYYMKISGGKDSTTWKREYLAEFIVDEEITVIPEFTKDREQEIVRKSTRPSHFDAYVAMDVGFTDNTAILFGYWDFNRALLVIEDELILNKKNVKDLRTDIIGDAIIAKEKELWGAKKPFLRVADADPILLNDIKSACNLAFTRTDKDNKEAQVNEVRQFIQRGMIVIDPRCVNTINHLRYAIWNSARTEFARVSAFGHFDAVDALIYMLRNVRRNKNPYPAEYETDIWGEKRVKNPNSTKTAINLKVLFTDATKRFRRDN